jgi:two-component system, chemotaxis family, protein-glutamate methylesterase/glutaminase
MAHSTRDIIVIGASAGGVEALQNLMGGLRPDLPAAVFVVLHLWPGSPSYLASILSRAGQLPAVMAEEGMPIERGKVYCAPSDYHLLLENEHMRVVRGPRENRFRPAVNPLFRSAAVSHRNRTVGVVLTGLLDDGAAGLWAIKQCGGVTVVQSDAAFDQMPRAALDNVEVDYHVPLAAMPELFARLTREPLQPGEPPPVPEVIRINDEGAKMKPVGFKLDEIGKRSLFTCPECNGSLWEIEEGKHVHFRCHVGHAYTGDSLESAQSMAVEQSLWSALRALKESAALDERLASRSTEHGLTAAAHAHQSNANRKKAQAQQMENFLTHFQPSEKAPAGEAGR